MSVWDSVPDLVVTFDLDGADTLVAIGADQVVWVRVVGALARYTRHNDDGGRPVEIVDLQNIVQNNSFECSYNRLLFKIFRNISDFLD